MKSLCGVCVGVNELLDDDIFQQFITAFRISISIPYSVFTAQLYSQQASNKGIVCEK